MDIESTIAKLISNVPFLSVEVSPSVSARLDETLIESLRTLHEADTFVCTDSPLARFKPSSVISSIKLQHKLHKPVICTLSMRDRNSIALCGDILAANELGLRTFLALTGDSIKHGDCPQAKGVFEDNALKLGRIIDDLNMGKALSGKPLKAQVDRIYYFHVIPAYANNPQSLIMKMEKKIKDSHTCALFTQPVYSLEAATFLLEGIAKVNAALGSNCALVLGFFPVMSAKTALFLRDKLPGVYIPNEWVEKLEAAHAKSADVERAVGLEISQTLFNELKTLHNKFHFMSAKPSLLKAFV